jgi:hypothetical protein
VLCYRLPSPGVEQHCQVDLLLMVHAASPILRVEGFESRDHAHQGMSK